MKSTSHKAISHNANKLKGQLPRKQHGPYPTLERLPLETGLARLPKWAKLTARDVERGVGGV